jgi:hypothetical protein
MRFAGGLNDYVLTIDHDEGEGEREGGSVLEMGKIGGLKNSLLT